MAEPRPLSLNRRTLVGGAAWTLPAVTATLAAPRVSASSPADCYTGNMGGALTVTSSVTATTVTDGSGVKWRRFDYTHTAVLDQWSGAAITGLTFVIPFLWTGPLATSTSGPWTAATWDDAAGQWTSNRADSLDSAVYLTGYGSTTSAPRDSFATYTAMPYYPMSNTSAGPGSYPSNTVPDSADVFAIPFTPSPLPDGGTATAQFSLWVQYQPDGTSLMATSWWGDYMGIGCGP